MDKLFALAIMALAACGAKAKPEPNPANSGSSGGAAPATADCCCYHNNPEDPSPDLRGEAMYERLNAEACATKSGKCVEMDLCGEQDCPPNDPNCLDTSRPNP